MIEEFEVALAKERAHELVPTIAAMSDIKPPKHLRLIQGTVKAFYDDGFELAIELELHPQEHTESIASRWTPYVWALIAIGLIGTASFLCGRFWK